MVVRLLVLVLLVGVFAGASTMQQLSDLGCLSEHDTDSSTTPNLDYVDRVVADVTLSAPETEITTADWTTPSPPARLHTLSVFRPPRPSRFAA